jgi:hypothetical protein
MTTNGQDTKFFAHNCKGKDPLLKSSRCNPEGQQLLSASPR